jgi:hypothetical protein
MSSLVYNSTYMTATCCCRLWTYKTNTTRHSLLNGSFAQDDWPQDKSRALARVLLVLTWLHVSSIKVDPYLNVDAGTMNPKEYAQSYT